jgi:hypothetical protein
VLADEPGEPAPLPARPADEQAAIGDGVVWTTFACRDVLALQSGLRGAVVRQLTPKAPERR